MKTSYLKLMLLSLALASLNILTLNAQIFKVMATKGKPNIQKQSDGKAIKAAYGTKINANDKIKIESGDYILLYHIADGKTLELAKQGSYTAESLSKQLASKKNSVAQKYVDFLMDELVDDNENNNRKAGGKMVKTGAVQRAVGDEGNIIGKTKDVIKTDWSKSNLQDADVFGKAVDNLIVVYPKNSNIIDDKLSFKWRILNGAKEYTLSITDSDGKKLIEKKTNDNALDIDLSSLKLEKNNSYYWTLKSSGGNKQTTEEFTIFKLSEENEKLVSDTIQIIKNDFQGEDSPACMLILARFYESWNIQNRAFAIYEDLIAKNPESDDFKKAYIAFLRRMNVE